MLVLGRFVELTLRTVGTTRRVVGDFTGRSTATVWTVRLAAWIFDAALIAVVFASTGIGPAVD